MLLTILQRIFGIQYSPISVRIKNLVSTGEPPSKEFEIKGIVQHYQSQQWAKQQFGREIWHNEIVHEVIKILVKDALELDANAIYGLRVTMCPDVGAMATGVLFHIYGTAIKMS